jgi:hypothetical protein
MSPRTELPSVVVEQILTRPLFLHCISAHSLSLSASPANPIFLKTPSISKPSAVVDDTIQSVALGFSHFCDLFTQSEWEVFGYLIGAPHLHALTADSDPLPKTIYFGTAMCLGTLPLSRRVHRKTCPPPRTRRFTSCCAIETESTCPLINMQLKHPVTVQLYRFKLRHHGVDVLGHPDKRVTKKISPDSAYGVPTPITEFTPEQAYSLGSKRA